MILDNDTMYADDLAHGGTPTEVDLTVVDAGKGEPLNIFIQGHSLTSAGNLTFAFQTSATSGSGHATEASLVVTPAEANAGINFVVPNAGVKRYSQVTLSGSTGGTWSCGIVMPGIQTAV